MGIRVPRPWRLDSPRISGASLNCFSIRSRPLLGWNPNVCGDVVKHLSLSRRSQNDREGVLANILYPIQIGPNDREGVLASSLEHIHRLVGFYQLHMFLLQLPVQDLRLVSLDELQGVSSAYYDR